MCGILGGNNKNWNYKAAVESLYHRGPDAQKITCVGDMWMGFTRLAIIDLREAAMQPMISGDGNYAIVFNGEIYSYKEIRLELEKKGYQFQTLSDTEVLLYSFIEWKEAMVDHIDGIFAIAVMDVKANRIYLFRDRAGVKPLYYLYDGFNFAFASELKGIEKMCNNISFQYDNTALYDYHTYLYIPEPKTMYKNVYKLEHATYLVFDLNTRQILQKERYWKVKINTHMGDKPTSKRLSDKADELRYHLERVVEKQMVADVPLGTFLSGGVDSSIITSIAKKRKADITAYSIGFLDKRYDESCYAKEIAEKLGINCKVRAFDSAIYDELYPILPRFYDEPFADTSAYPTYMVSKFAREDVTVVLTGDGADELFGGYPRHTYVRNVVAVRKSCPNKFIQKYGHNVLKKYHELDTFFKEDLELIEKQYLYKYIPDKEVLRKKYKISSDYDDYWYYRKYYHKELPPLTRMRYMDFMTYLPGDILTKVDRASMQVSLEARVPFLDKEVIDFAFSLSQEECNPAGELKGLLKYAYEQELTKKFLNRSKQGFSIPQKYLKKKCSPQEYLIDELWEL